jgi:hypothetical protein
MGLLCHTEKKLQGPFFMRNGTCFSTEQKTRLKAVYICTHTHTVYNLQTKLYERVYHVM